MGDDRKLNLLPRLGEETHPEEPGEEGKSLWALLAVFPPESISALLLPSRVPPSSPPLPSSLPSVFFLLFSPFLPSFFPLTNIY